VNEAARARALLGLGVAGLITDDVGAMSHALGPTT
jgi:hypothetical protein